MTTGANTAFIFLNSHPVQYFAPLYRYLAANGVDLEVIYCSGQPGELKFDREFGREIEWDIPLLEGYRHHFLENHGIRPAGKKWFSLVNRGIVPYLFRKKKATLVIHSWQYATDWLAILFGKLAGHRIALWTEANGAQERLAGRTKKIVKRIFLQSLFLFVNEYWCIGSQNRAFYASLGVKPQRMRATPYSVDNERFRQAAKATTKQQARVELNLPADGFIIAFSGKYIPKKRPLDLLQAFAVCNNPTAHLLMMGEGALRGEMERFIAGQGLSGRVTLTGFVNQSKIPLYYRAADIFVMCSGTGETWGLSVNEAMNFSLPLLLSDLTGCSADLVRQGENGWVFTTGDTDELAQRINQLASMAPEQLEAMGCRSLEIVQAYSYAAIMKGILGGCMVNGQW